MFSLGLLACSTLDRSNSSGYAGYESGPSHAQQFYLERQAKKIQDAKEELGIQPNRELTEVDMQSIQTRAELSRLESAIASSSEKKQYYAFKPYFNSDLERIYFLRLPNPAARARWASAKGLSTDETAFDPAVTSLIENNDISKGMSRGAVRQSWGEPDFVEIAGDHLYGNERWRYNKLISSEDGYKSETRIIFFESGRVIGWETL